ncbi:MAG: hypothetical protein Q7S65_04615 [Nanoarchaeota archaeon]|nr:hypothetical protein [Nanoarchaeota archaeon]
MHLMELLGEAFKLAGFSVSWNVPRGGYTVELLAQKNIEDEYEDFTVACGCALSKNLRQQLEELIKAKKKLKVNALILVVTDDNILGEDTMIADRHTILVWGKKNLDYYLKDLRKDPETGTRKLLSALGHGSYININTKSADFNAPEEH